MQLLTTSDLRYFTPLAVEGAQAFRLRPQIDRALESSLGQGASSLLATAVEGAAAGALEWHTALQGTPVPRANLSSEDKLTLDSSLSQAATGIQAEAGRLAISQSKDDRILGGILLNIAGSLGNAVFGDWRNLSAFMVGGWPVVAGWGLVPTQDQAGAAPAPQAGPAPQPQAWGAPLPQAGTAPLPQPGKWQTLGKFQVKPVVAIAALTVLVILLVIVLPILKDLLFPAYKLGEGFVIPKDGDPKDLSFLEGCWESGSNLRNADTKMPIIHEYCINDNGTGTFTIKEFDKAGRLTDTCNAGTLTTREVDVVEIMAQRAKCGKGNYYTPHTIRCTTGPDKITICKGKGTGGATYETIFTYQGKN
ncbi:MAG: hypothetical protein LBF40_01555 [Deltaproteobacteria bacterium]|nr:hypothetical protein [Deltaproteobacteria bacterium]